MKSDTTARMSASTRRTLNLLADTLLNLLEDYSLEKITTKDICCAAEVPRSTFYNHFEDKYDLFRYAMKSLVSKIGINDTYATDKRQYIENEIDSILAFAQDNYQFVKKVNSANSNGILFAEIKSFLFDRLLNRLNEEKTRGKQSLVDEYITAEIYSNAIVYSAKTWIEKDMLISANEIKNALINLLLPGENEAH